MKKEKGMRSATMPKEHWEMSEKELKTCNLKYASQFGNPGDLQRSADSLADYVKKHKMNY